MKILLIALNILLVAAVGHLAWTYSADPVSFSFPSKTRKPVSVKVEKVKTARAKPAAKAVLDSPEVTERKISALVEHNIFKTERVPDAPANRTAQRNSQQIRADMSLVGTYVIGDSLGAIILQRLQGNAQQQLKALQQKEYEQYASSTRVTDPKKKAEAAAAAAAGEGESDKEDDEGDSAPEKRTVIMGNPTISANNVFRQHLKVGDTTVNGYKLEEVTRTTAVLTKNSERIELSLLTPSEAGNISRQRQQQQNNNNNRNNNNNNNNRNQQNNNNNNRNNNNARTNNNNNNRNNNNARTNNNNNNRNNNNARTNNNNRNNRDDFEWL